MKGLYYAGVAAALIASSLVVRAQQQAPSPAAPPAPAAPTVATAAPPPTATTKVADSVYIFRYGGHQAMFVVTPAGVIATDPISLRRPVMLYGRRNMSS